MSNSPSRYSRLQQLVRKGSSHLLAICGFAAALVTVIWTSVWLQLATEQNSLQRSHETDVANLAVVFEQNVTRTLTDIDRLLLFLREVHDRSPSGADWATIVRGRFTSDKETLQIAVTDVRGRMITSSMAKPGDKPVDLSDREHVRIHMHTTDDQLFISKPVIGRVTRKPSIQLSRRYFDKEGKFGGVVVVSLDPEYLSRAYGGVELGQDSGLALVGSDDVLRAGTGSYHATVGRSITDAVFTGRIQMASSGTAIHIDESGGRYRVIGTRPVPGLPLYVLVGGGDLTKDTNFLSSKFRYVIGATALTFTTFVAMIAAFRTRKKHDSHINYLAKHDVLTGLHNRTQLNEQLERAFQGKSSPQVTLHLIDLDRFKFVNDTYGHPAGDKLLTVVADRLRKNLRKCDVIARIGGDEFAVAQSDVFDVSDVTTVAERLVRVLNEKYEIDGTIIEIGASIGIGVSSIDCTTPDQLMKTADLALYAAKSEGRGCFRFFAKEMELAVKQQRQLQDELRSAIENDELELHYQPINDIATGDVTAYEALVRWRHPVRGLVPPMEFIPIAEDTGLIVPIGEWVLRRACTDMASRPSHLKVAINISPIQFKDPHLVQSVKNALSDSGLAPERLEVEITESVLMQQDTLTLKHLRELRDLGIRISMDDFGTGYSSLSYLQNYPISCIKIDRSFVKTLGTSGSAAAIIRAITSLAGALDLGTIAEGVETKEQLDELQRLGCDEAQGFYFSRPKPASQIFQPVSVESRAA